MSGVTQVRQGGPATFEAAEAITGGTFVEGRTGIGAGGLAKIGVAAAGSVKSVGVALHDAAARPASNFSEATTGADGRPVISSVTTPFNVAVAYGDTEVKVLYSANAAFGDLLVITTGGKVAPAGATPDARTIVGRCTEPGGVVFATNPRGLVRIGN